MEKEFKFKHFSLRLPNEMRNWLVDESARRFQSQNAMIIEILRKEMNKEVKGSE